MSTDRDERLFGDPLFQLNLVLWALQPLGDDAPTHAPLAKAGYAAHSLARPLSPGPKLQETLRQLTGSPHGPAPDVIAEPMTELPWLLIECKRTGFSPASSTARQAVKIIAIREPFLEAYGTPTGHGDVAALFLTRDLLLDEFAQTLSELMDSVTPITQPCTVAIAAIKRMTGGVGICLFEPTSTCHVSMGFQKLSELLGPECLVLVCEPDDDPRVFYFIPYDPSIEYDSTTVSSREEAKQDLLLRAATAAITLIGPARVPGRIAINTEDLLVKATLNMSPFWNAAEVKKLCDLVGQYLQRAISGSISPPPAVEKNGSQILVTLRTEKQRDAVLDVLSQPLGIPLTILETAAAQTEFTFPD